MILEMPTIFQRQEALEMLPTDLYDSFRDIITRLRRRPTASAELGMRVLMWLHFAYRPLKLVELQHALSVKKGRIEFDLRNIPSPKVLLDSCLGLVLVDEETMTVRFVHFTLEEYFRENAGTEFPNGCSSIAETCLTYLNFGGLKQHCMDLDSLKEKSTEYTFLNYAALYWGTYVKQQCSDSLTELATVILEHENECPPIAIQALYHFQISWWSRSVAKKFSGIHVMAYFGLSENMAKFSEMDPKDESGRTPLFWAASGGHEAVVRLLIERDGVDINAKDNDSWTPLMSAATRGHEAVVRLLIERDGVDINAKYNDGRTPLLFAASRGYEAVVRLLIERDGVDLNAKDNDGRTPLIWAAYQGYEAVAQLLIERDHVDINAKDNGSWTPLISAAYWGYKAVVRLLIERDDIDINAKDNKGKTALMKACRYGNNEAVVRLLIERDGVSINAKNNKGETALMKAARYGREAVVRLLIERDDIDISAEDDAGRTALTRAAEKEHEAIVQLLNKRCNMLARSSSIRPASSLARGIAGVVAEDVDGATAT